MIDIEFSSSLDEGYRNELEALMFFNPLQQKMQARIADSIHHFGVPAIEVSGSLLRFGVEGLAEVQTLYALEKAAASPVLAGAMIYARVDKENLVILHIAVSEDYALDGSKQECMLAVRLIAQLRAVARTIRDVKRIILMYGNDAGQQIPV